jgi:hypothetical protein
METHDNIHGDIEWTKNALGEQTIYDYDLLGRFATMIRQDFDPGLYIRQVATTDTYADDNDSRLTGLIRPRSRSACFPSYGGI